MRMRMTMTTRRGGGEGEDATPGCCRFHTDHHGQGDRGGEVWAGGSGVRMALGFGARGLHVVIWCRPLDADIICAGRLVVRNTKSLVYQPVILHPLDP